MDDIKPCISKNINVKGDILTRKEIESKIEILECHLQELDERISYLLGEIKELEEYKDKAKKEIRRLADMFE